MTEPFKSFFNKEMIAVMGKHFLRVFPDFDVKGFCVAAADNLEALELKERSAQITDALYAFFPDDFEQASTVIMDSLAPDESEVCDVNMLGISGWGIMPMTHYVGTYGLNHFDISMTLLKEMTKRFTSEFDIRFFLLAHPERTLDILETWALDPSHHVRRLVSEGTRPRLPWAMKLQNFIDDPAPVISLLEILKDDEEEYVRRSVANNLNDIAKDHPDLVADIAEEWMKDANKNRKRLVKHACRTLIKQGHQKTLKALGYGKPQVALEHFKIVTPQVEFGNALMFEMSLASTSDTPQDLIIDYTIHHRKANGTTSAKVFKWKNTTLLPSGKIKASRKHNIKKITTRTYYEGIHYLEISVNGIFIGKDSFYLNGIS
jgi:3-methyladenine DNA glycosylase AlkC